MNSFLPKPGPLEIDEQFLTRVYRTCLLLGGFVTLVLAAYSLAVAASFLIGGAISVSLLRALEYVVRKTFVPEKQKAKRSFVLFTLAKYTLIMVSFYFLVRTKWLNAPALAGGLGLTQAVIALKAFGIVLVNAMNRSSKS